MFTSAETLHDFTHLLDQRQASIWHACQAKDLRSYLEIGGVPSRRRLEQDRRGFTQFVSDPDDRVNGVWDKVFFNLGDYGRPFAWGVRATPTVYGPIALQFAPRALEEADDVAVCLRSAAARGFDRAAESLDTADEVDRLFEFPLEIGFPRTTYVKFADSLRAAFPFAKGARRPEISCSTASGAISFDALVVVWVDPIEVDGVRLIDEVRRLLDEAGVTTTVHERSITGERRSVLADIVNELRHGYVPLKLLPTRAGVSDLTRDWADGVRELELDWLWDRYARYLIEGTLNEMSGGDAPATYVERPRPSAPRPTRVAEILEGLKEQ